MSSTNWKQIIKNYNKPSVWRSSWQLFNSLGLYFLAWYIAYLAFEISPLLSVLVALVAQIFYGRLFIIMHDCGHGSFFKSKKARTFWGYVTAIAWATPYEQWTKYHATHHRHSGNLEERGLGDIWTLTTKEYEEASILKKFFYRVCRYPIFVIFFGGIYVFFIAQRFTTKHDGPKQKKSVWITNIALVVLGTTASLLTSVEFFLTYQIALLYFGSCLSVYLFYVQHQYEDVYWEENEKWSYETAAMHGCSYFKLPRLLQWASGNIGFHHIHHLSHAIPNYYLEKAMRENSYFQNPYTLTLKTSIKTFNLALYDYKQRKMLTFKQYKAGLKAQKETFAKDFTPQKDPINA